VRFVAGLRKARGDMETERLASLPKISLIIDGGTYNLCGDFGALAEAEAFFNLQGREINVAAALFDVRDTISCLSALRQVFPCALRRFHQEIDYAAAQEMIDRMVAQDDPSFALAIEQMWPRTSEETQAVNNNLTFELEALAKANEFFRGKACLALICVEGPFTLEHICSVFACAVHQYRPGLNLDEARRLMTLRSIFLVIEGLGLVWQTASEESRQRFVERVMAAASDDEKKEFLYRVLSKKPWPGTAQA
jgi:hypothetical protein